MRTVSGRTDRIVVIGAGLAGLSTALHLAGQGREVVVVDQRDQVGGVCGQLQLTSADGGTYTFDTGPTVMTMPDLLDDAFSAVGESRRDWVSLRKLDPGYRAVYADGSRIDVLDTIEGTADSIEKACGADEAAGFRDFAAFASKLYDVEYSTFIDHNIDSPLSLLAPDLLRLSAMGGFRTLAGKVAQYLKDPRTQKLFSFQALYAGVAPTAARALYAVITYMDSVEGVYFAEGGMHALASGLAGAADKHGVEFRLGTAVQRVVLDGRRATGVVLSDGERITADAVVVTADPDIATQDLFGRRRPVRPRRHSPSCLLLHVGGNVPNPYDAHHTIHFGEAWDSTFTELTRSGRLMSDPSILVTNTSRSAPELVPADRQSYYILAPTPNLTAGIDWDSVKAPYTAEVLKALEARGYDWSGVEVQEGVSPLDWAQQGLPAGTPFSLAHTMTQTGPFRPANFPRRYDNVVFAGMGTTPGVGVPMVLVSGKLAAQRITGG